MRPSRFSLRTRRQRPTPEPRYLMIGKVLRPHGVRGEISVQILTDFPERFLVLETVYLSLTADLPDAPTRYALEGARPQRKTNWLIRLAGIADRDAADRLRDQYVYVAIDQAVPLEDDELYLYQVIGAQVETTSGEVIGQVVDLIETGANDVYVVRGTAYGEVLIPAINGVVLSIDADAHRMVIDPLPGLLPDPLAAPDVPDDDDDDREADDPADPDSADSDSVDLDA